MATKKIKVPTLDYETLVTIEVSGWFHTMLQTTLVGISQGKQEEFKKAIEKLKTGEPPLNAYEGEIHVIAILINSIETAAKAQGKVSEKEIEVDDNFNPTGN
jgi:hypothetical protein